jgi:RNA exonuclease 4
MPRRRGKTLKALKKKAAAFPEEIIRKENDDEPEVATYSNAVKFDRTPTSRDSLRPAKRTCDDRADLGVKRQRTTKAPLTIKEAVRLQKINDAALKQSAVPPQPSKLGVVDISHQEQGNYVGLDCEMVGIGEDGKTSILARACVVDWHGKIMYDSFVKVDQRVTDFRTQFSGVRPSNLKSKDAASYTECVGDVAALIKGKVLVGHALKNDLKVLMLSHPRMMIRDTATYRPFMRYFHGKFKPRKLKDLAKEHLNMQIQGGEHTPDEDASAAMLLYRAKRAEWESNLKIFRGKTSKAVSVI